MNDKDKERLPGRNVRERMLNKIAEGREKRSLADLETMHRERVGDEIVGRPSSEDSK